MRRSSSIQLLVPLLNQITYTDLVNGSLQTLCDLVDDSALTSCQLIDTILLTWRELADGSKLN